MIVLNFAFVLLTICMMDLEKIVALGERLGLEGKKLQELVAFREGGWENVQRYIFGLWDICTKYGETNFVT